MYVGQSGHAIGVRYKEHIQNNCHEFGPAHNTLKLFKPCTKGTLMNCWENFFIQKLSHQMKLIDEQNPPEPNPLFTVSCKSQLAA
jgi:hypothetical protein